MPTSAYQDLLPDFCKLFNLDLHSFDELQEEQPVSSNMAGFDSEDAKEEKEEEDENDVGPREGA